MKITLYFLLLVSSQAHSIEEKIFDLNGNEPTEKILEKLGGPNNKEVHIDILKSPKRIVSIDFNPAKSITISDKDLFEPFEIQNANDRINYKLIIADPKSGRIFHLTPELKVTKLDLVEPWQSKQKMKSIKEILTEMHKTMIVKKAKK